MSRPTNRIWLSPPHMGGGEAAYVKEAFETNWVAPMGPHVDRFEEELAAFVGVKHVAALSSGTAAIHLALIILGVERGDEVLASSFTFSATVNPIVYQGATPVLVDSEPGTWNMCPDLLEEAIRGRLGKGKKPRAIIPVHLYGMPARMDRIMEIAGEHGIPVIEDAAEALGSSYRGRMLGSLGDMAVLSFNGNKIITTSGGGALLSGSGKHIREARFLATQARDEAPHYQHSHIGFNYRMSNVLAGIGRGQMEVIGERIRQRRANNAFYREFLQGVQGIAFQDEPDGDFFSNYWLTAITVDPALGVNPEVIREALERERIDCRPLWKPMHLQPVFTGCPAYVNGVSENLFNRGLCLPSGSGLTPREKAFIRDTLSRVIMNK